MRPPIEKWLNERTVSLAEASIKITCLGLYALEQDRKLERVEKCLEGMRVCGGAKEFPLDVYSLGPSLKAKIETWQEAAAMLAEAIREEEDGPTTC